MRSVAGLGETPRVLGVCCGDSATTEVKWVEWRRVVHGINSR